MKRYKYPFYIAFHPSNGYEEMLWRKEGSMAVSIVILAVWFLISIVERQLTGFNFNNNRPDKLNILLILVPTLLVFVLWVISNWAICTLLDGKGHLRDIWIVCSYALIPYILFVIAVTFMSNFVTKDEGTFLTWAMWIGEIWSVVLFITGLKTLHQYTFGKTIWSMLLTILCIVIIVFLSVLVFSLFQQIYVFLATIFQEIMFRL